MNLNKTFYFKDFFIFDFADTKVDERNPILVKAFFICKRRERANYVSLQILSVRHLLCNWKQAWVPAASADWYGKFCCEVDARGLVRSQQDSAVDQNQLHDVRPVSWKGIKRQRPMLELVLTSCRSYIHDAPFEFTQSEMPQCRTTLLPSQTDFSIIHKTYSFIPRIERTTPSFHTMHLL